MLSVRRWRARHLLLAWGAYWLGLILIAVGPGLAAAWRATRPEQKGNISVSYDDGVINAIVVAGETTLWSAAVEFSTITLWIAGPPVLLWLLWLATRPRRGATTEVR